MALRPSRVALFALSVSFLVACGGSETIDEPASGGAGSGATAGAAGAGAGASGGSGASGKGGSAGGTGGAGASGGSSGAAGKGGAGGGGAGGAGGGTAGKGGASGGKGGAAGASGGTGGSAGSAGSAGGASCKVDTDCTGQIPVTTPAGCAELFCEPTSGVCAVRARDKDKDGHRGAACKAIDGTSIATGDDCDDNDAETHPGAWDGPADGANPDRCDGKDQNCSNEPDDQKTAAGKSCLCNPGDALVCGEDGGGKTIAFPMLDANGKPVGKCKLGKKTCGGDGKWGPCVGAVPPEKLDICNGGVDDDCDGKADLEDDTAPPNLVTWSYDGDGDGYVDKTDPTVKSSACDDKAPTVCPTSVPGCDLGKWKLGSLPAKDCNDKDGDVNPAGVELCDGVDNDCNGVIDDDYASNASLWYFDWDGDNYGDINTTPKKSCSPPTTFPAGCADLVANTPADYCAGVAGEGDVPTCPAAACDVSMWKKNIPNTDCKDRPDQALTGVTKGSNPKVVYPGATDLCNGRDYNCDGSPDTACGCNPVGKVEACGAADTCNVGTKTCLAGGTWEACSGGPEKGFVTYCPDDDGDKFCDLDACVTVCPGATPIDGHTYIDKSTCTGFAQPNNGGDDCDDKDKDSNPGILNEICSGDGKDHNCNGTKNMPGLGDCACTDSPLDQPCNPPATVYPTGKNPGDPLLGECKWGMRKCVFGQYTACTGGVGMEAQELCVAQSSPDYGKDFDCDGKSNKTAAQGGECGCSGTETRACGCTGTESCSNGAWTGQCNSDTPMKEYCLDADNDQVCAGGCTQKCPGTYAGQRERSTCYQNATVVDCADANNARGQNKQELCSSTDENCDAGQLAYDGYVWQNGLGFNAACTRGKGSCYRTGTNYCATTMATDCSAATVTPPGGFVTAAVSGSFDTTCDGKLQYDSSTALTFSPRALMDKQANCLQPAAFNCSFAAQVSGIVDQTFYMFVPCASHVIGSLPAPEGTSLDDAPNYSWRFGTVPNCGSTVGWAICLSSGGGNYTGPTTAGEINSFKQGCK